MGNQMFKLLLTVGLLMVVTVTPTQLMEENSMERALAVFRGDDTVSTYKWNSSQKKCYPSGKSTGAMTKANTSTKCSNYSKCKYTGTCGYSSKSYMWLTSSNSDVRTSACYGGVNYSNAYPLATSQQQCKNMNACGDIAISSCSSGGATEFLWFLCCIYCVVGIPVFVCWYCNSCCCKGRGRGSHAAPPAPAPAAPAPVIVQVFNDNGGSGSGSDSEKKKKKKKSSDSDS